MPGLVRDEEVPLDVHRTRRPRRVHQGDLLAINSERKKEAKQLADAAKAAAKKTLQEAKAKERAEKMAAKARARSAAGRSPRNPAARRRRRHALGSLTKILTK